MNKTSCAFVIFIMFSLLLVAGNRQFDKDTVKTGGGDLVITFLGHGTLMFDFNKAVIYVDPFSRVADFSALPPADLILITHHHGDHLDLAAIKPIRQEKTVIIGTQKCVQQVEGCIVMNNGDAKTAAGFKIEAVPAYNILHKRESGEPFHVKGEGNGYIITFGDKRVYVAGDAENIPEMKELKNIAAAFLPMNLPYTMTPEMTAEAAKAFRPGILYPYHYTDTDTKRLVELLKNEKDIDVRIRSLYPAAPE
ncbi:MAG: MBL fold metallo-hydrolase [Candidatus Aminicenantes bacterium]|nr:MBL fold metallo-hydrolase [Candidatus Aminicenantes bacterium]